VLAAAGLKRLGLESRIRDVFEPGTMLPAAGQGALGIEIRSERLDVQRALSSLVHPGTWLRVAAERAVSRAMGGSCSMPLAAYATLEGGRLQIDAAWGDPEGRIALVQAAAGADVADLAAAAALGERVAAELKVGVQRVGGSLTAHTA
jgi:hydroxymethylbilane synthase